MKYRKLPHGNEMFSTIGFSMDSIHVSSINEMNGYDDMISFRLWEYMKDLKNV